jgi:tetratricopeptide (TPR) repeat protein
MLDIEFFGLDPKGHHIVNVIFHMINTFLLYFLLFRTTKSHWKSYFVAALFALHPLHVESVAWVAERKDVLSAFFFFITLISYDWYVSRPGSRRYLFTLFAFALGLMSKPMLVTLPFVLLLMDYWPLQRISLMRGKVDVQDTNPGEKEKLPLKQLILEKLPFLALSIVSSIITFYAQSRGGAVAKIKLVPINFRFLNALNAYVDYIFKTIWPHNLSVIYPLPDTITILQGLTTGLFLTVISTISIRMTRRHPYLIVGWLWYIGTLVPVIGLVQVGRQSMADRYTYLPLIGLFIIASWGIPSMMRNARYRNIILSFMSILFLLTYSLFTWFQLSYWKNSVTLFRHATQAVTNNYSAYNLLGSTYTKSGMLDDAISNFSKVLRIYPDDEEAITGTGIALAKKGDLEGAIPYFRQAIYLKPNSAECHSNLGFALLQRGKDADGIRHLLEAIRLQSDSPNNAEILFHIGTSFAAQEKIDQSIDYFVKAIRMKPDFAEAHYNLGVALAKQGKWDQAIAGFSMALQLKPDLPEAAPALEKAKRLKGR